MPSPVLNDAVQLLMVVDVEVAMMPSSPLL